MVSSLASRAAMRQSRLFLRRNHNIRRQASSTAEAAAKAKETAQAQVSKASEGLSRVTSSAGDTLTKLGSGASSALSRVGGRTGRLLRFVESLVPPTIYYGRVGLELGKIVARGQKFAPPTLSQFQAYWSPLANAVRNPKTAFTSLPSTETVLRSVRNVNRQQLATVGVVGAEVLGFFTVGTMIGRLKVVGYHGQPHHEH
ncbi:hypothetical protein DV738_g3873, partial [Chaetothyriales sp. CBS 135597]